jgi:hypothetical protein
MEFKKLPIISFCNLALLSILALLALFAFAAAPAGADTNPSVAVAAVQISSAVFMPGDAGTVTVTISNTPTTLAGSSTTMSDTYNYGAGTSNGMTTPSHVAVSSTTSSNMPDSSYVLQEVTLLADSPIFVTSNGYNDTGRLGVGNSASFTFMIKADSSAADGIYRLMLKVRTSDGDVYLNYPIKLQVESNEPQIVVSRYAKEYNGTDNGMSVDVFNPRDTPIQAASIKTSGDDFIFEPQSCFIGNMAAGGTYSADFNVQSIDSRYDNLPQFVLVYKNGDNWHQTAAICAACDPPVKDWWTIWYESALGVWWPYFLAGALCAIVIVVFGAFVFRRSKSS